MKKQTGIWLALVLSFCMSCENDSPENVLPDDDVEWTETGKHEEHDFVDLGLPSGALWATADVSAATKEGKVSVFFSWGETLPKTSYTSATYEYAAGADSMLTKYCTDAECGRNGFTDGLVKLQPTDDAANVHWGGSWYIPTADEWSELYEGCTWETMKENGTICFVGTSKANGKQIAFPAVGAMQGEKLLYGGKGAYYWSSTLIADHCLYADGLSLSASSINKKEGKRAMGHCVRAVIPGERVPSKSVDLGLPSGIKWACCNIGAKSPELAGNLYAWGESEIKPYYDFTNYKFCHGTPKTLTKYCTDSGYGTPDGKTQLDAEDDTARQLWGEKWRMPTVEDIQELMDNCTWIFETVDGRKGYTVTGKNGNSIHIPLAGTMWQTEMEYQNMRGFYWGATLDDAGDMWAEGLFVNPQSFSLGANFTRASGRTVRPVRD